MPPMVVVAKPVFVNFSVYVPGAMLGNTYCPDEFVVPVFVSFVAAFVRSTVASGTTAPPGSITVPSTMPVFAVCPAAGMIVQSANRTKRPANPNRTNSFISPPTQTGFLHLQWPAWRLLVLDR